MPLLLEDPPLHKQSLVSKGLTYSWEVLFWGLVALTVVPIWLVHYFPTSDGPAHVANAFVLRHYNDPLYSEFRHYYQHNPKPVPNYVTNILLAILMSVCSPAAAEKIFLSAYTVMLPLAARFAFSAIRYDSRFLALLMFPFVHNVLFLKGFYNFCLGLPMFFLIAGYCFRTPKPFRARQTILLSGMLVVQYFCHIVPLVMSLLVLAMVGFFYWWEDASWSGKWLTAANRHWLPLLAAVAPLSVLAFLFLSHRNNHLGFSIGIVDRLIQLATCYSLVAYDTKEVILSTGVAAILILLAIAARGKRDTSPLSYSLLGCLVASVLVYLVSPNAVGNGTFITERLLLFVYFCLLLWLASRSFSHKAFIVIQVVAVLLSVSLTIPQTLKQRQADAMTDEFLSVSRLIPPNTTVFPIIYSFRGETPDGREMARRVMPFANLSSRIAAERGVVDLHNYEAWAGDFPLDFRPEMNPLLHLSAPGGMFQMPPVVDLLGYHSRTGGDVSYVVVWSVGNVEANPRSKPILDQLAAAYDYVAGSTPNGYARLYRLRSRRIIAAPSLPGE